MSKHEHMYAHVAKLLSEAIDVLVKDTASKFQDKTTRIQSEKIKLQQLLDKFLQRGLKSLPLRTHLQTDTILMVALINKYLY